MEKSMLPPALGLLYPSSGRVYYLCFFDHLSAYKGSTVWMHLLKKHWSLTSGGSVSSTSKSNIFLWLQGLRCFHNTSILLPMCVMGVRGVRRQKCEGLKYRRRNSDAVIWVHPPNQIDDRDHEIFFSFVLLPVLSKRWLCTTTYSLSNPAIAFTK